MVARKIASVLFLSALAVSCKQGLFGTLNRTHSDPFTETPVVSSFLSSRSICIEWSFDEGADEYIIERAPDNSLFLDYIEIYRGTSLSYIDSNLPDKALYFYRLSKRRGQETFPPSSPALGVSTITVRDTHEVNDTMEEATHLADTTLHANLPFFRAYNGQTVWDEDWYYVELPPGWLAKIEIDDLQAGYFKTITHFMIYVPGYPPFSVPQLKEIIIQNYEIYPRKCYFKIYPDEDEYVGSGFGGDIVDYTIRVIELKPFS